jgi:GAF domain-containing protein
LFGKAAALEHAALVIADLKLEAGYEAMREGRPGLVGRDMLLRPLSYEGRLLGMLQLINRTTGGFSAPDVHLVNYLAERLAEFLRDARARIRH